MKKRFCHGDFKVVRVNIKKRRSHAVCTRSIKQETTVSGLLKSLLEIYTKNRMLMS